MSGTDDTCVLRARGLRKQYGREGGLVRAVDGIDLDVAAGQTLAVMGPSGCGKSTLLHLLGGLDRPAAGELFFEDRRVDQLSERALAQLRRHEIGFVFQAFQLLDELTAQENVELPALLARSSPGQARCRARQLLEQVGLPVSWMAAVIAGTVVVVAALTLLPARAGARRPVAAVLRSD